MKKNSSAWCVTQKNQGNSRSLGMQVVLQVVIKDNDKWYLGIASSSSGIEIQRWRIKKMIKGENLEEEKKKAEKWQETQREITWEGMVWMQKTVGNYMARARGSAWAFLRFRRKKRCSCIHVLHDEELLCFFNSIHSLIMRCDKVIGVPFVLCKGR